LTVEYPSKEHAELAFTNDEYQSIVPLRDIAFEDVKILLVDSAQSESVRFFKLFFS